jgi:DnaJ family protein C protein 1
LNQVLNKNKTEKPKEEKPSETKEPEEVWTEEQQKALETALKKYPSSMSANERWTEIAKEVKGKNKKQCVDRYKYLSQMIKNKK